MRWYDKMVFALMVAVVVVLTWQFLTTGTTKAAFIAAAGVYSVNIGIRLRMLYRYANTVPIDDEDKKDLIKIKWHSIASIVMSSICVTFSVLIILYR